MAVVDHDPAERDQAVRAQEAGRRQAAERDLGASGPRGCRSLDRPSGRSGTNGTTASRRRVATCWRRPAGGKRLGLRPAPRLTAERPAPVSSTNGWKVPPMCTITRARTSPPSAATVKGTAENGSPPMRTGATPLAPEPLNTRVPRPPAWPPTTARVLGGEVEAHALEPAEHVRTGRSPPGAPATPKPGTATLETVWGARGIEPEGPGTHEARLAPCGAVDPLAEAGGYPAAGSRRTAARAASTTDPDAPVSRMNGNGPSLRCRPGRTS